MNTIRLYLHDLLFTESPKNFLDQIDVVLSIAHSHGIGVVPVLFDGVWNPKPRLGVQREPTPRLHNSMWVQSPGSEIFYDRSRWSGLQEYVQEVITRFKNDSRVLAWDLFNEPDQVDTVTLTLGSRDEKIKTATELVSQVFDWAQEISASQPLTTSRLSDLIRNVPSIPTRILIISGSGFGPNEIADLMKKRTWTCPVDVVVTGSTVADEWRKLASASGGKVAP